MLLARDETATPLEPQQRVEMRSLPLLLTVLDMGLSRGAGAL